MHNRNVSYLTICPLCFRQCGAALLGLSSVDLSCTAIRLFISYDPVFLRQ